MIGLKHILGQLIVVAAPRGKSAKQNVVTGRRFVGTVLLEVLQADLGYRMSSFIYYLSLTLNPLHAVHPSLFA